MQSIHLEPNLLAIANKLHPARWLIATDSTQAVALLRKKEDIERLEVTHEESQDSFEHLLTEALECWLGQSHTTPYLWIHSRGLNGPWDAPYEYRKLMCDSDDPDPPTDKSPPNFILESDFDPDMLFGIACGAGAQSVCIDQGIGLILQSLKELGIDQNCWISIAGLLGFPLGEHRRVGLGNRLDPTKLDHPSIADAYSDLFSNKLPLAWAKGKNEIALITDRWSARFDTFQDPSGKLSLPDASIGEVFCFPEDRWQQNEISSRVPDALSLLRQIAMILLENTEYQPTVSDHLADLLSELRSIQR
jgi:hypothetical protein